MMDMYALLMGGSGGGGGGLPTPTASDVGKALVVKKVPVFGAIIATEQTVAYDGNWGYPTENFTNASLLTVGTGVVWQIGNNVYSGVLFDDDGLISALTDDGEAGFTYSPEDGIVAVWASNIDDDEATIKVNIITSYNYDLAYEYVVLVLHDIGNALDKTTREIINVANTGAVVTFMPPAFNYPLFLDTFGYDGEEDKYVFTFSSIGDGVYFLYRGAIDEYPVSNS